MANPAAISARSTPRTLASLWTRAKLILSESNAGSFPEKVRDRAAIGQPPRWRATPPGPSRNVIAATMLSAAPRLIFLKLAQIIALVRVSKLQRSAFPLQDLRGAFEPAPGVPMHKYVQ